MSSALILVAVTACDEIIDWRGLAYDFDFDPAELQGEDFRVRSTVLEDEHCLESFEPRTPTIESYELADDHLTVRGPDGEQLFTNHSLTPRTYCRPLPGSEAEECIEFYNDRGYANFVREPGFSRMSGIRRCYESYNFITAITDSAPDQATEEPASSPDPSETSHAFTVADCTCAGVDIPLQVGASRARNNTISSKSYPSEVEFETDGGLVCDWQASHASENLTGTIVIDLQVTRLADQQQAQALLADNGKRVAEQQPWCEEDAACTVAAVDAAEDRAYLVRQTFYVGGDEIVKPSGHYGGLARLFQGSDGYLVMDLGISHPELEIGDTWVGDTATAIEACVARLAE